MNNGAFDYIARVYAALDSTSTERFTQRVRLRVLLLPVLQLIGVVAAIGLTYVLIPPSSFRTYLGAALFGASGAVFWSITELLSGAPESPGHLLWFVSRPIAGAATGLLMATIVIAGLISVFGSHLSLGSASVELASVIIAFVAGYRVRSFYELTLRLGHVIFAVPTPDDV